MSVSASIPRTIQIRRTSLAGLVAAAAVVAAATTWAVALAVDGSSTSTTSAARAGSSSPAVSAPAGGERGTASLMSFTPAQLLAGALGGYALPVGGRPMLESVLRSMSPQARRYTERVMGLTFEQLAAGAAGQP